MASRKGIHIYIPKYFMTVRDCINIFVLLKVLFMVWSNGMKPSSISQQLNWSQQLIILFFVCRRCRSLYNLEAIPIKSVEWETVFVGRDTVLFDSLN